MPPILIALGIVAAYFLIPKQQRSGGTVIVQTPTNTPVGAPSGGIVQPTGGLGVPNPATGKQSNAPNTAQSGVLATSPQAQRVVPVQQSVGPQFYSYGHVLAPGYIPTATPYSSGGAGGCGCGGGCGSKKNGSSDCSISKSRNTNSGCMAPTTKSLIEGSSQSALGQWLANLASSPDANFMTVFHDMVATQQNNAPPGFDVTPAAGQISPRIGLSHAASLQPGLTLV